MHIGRLSILGTGLLGGSIGLACHETLKPIEISGYNRNPEALQRAIERGAIDQAFDTPAAAVVGADVVILCTPVGSFSQLLRDIAGSLKPGAIVTDVGSTKRSVVALAGRTLPDSVHFVGSHPMAGGEKQGIEHARADLLAGARCIITATEKTDAGAVETVEQFWRQLGMETVRLNPELHDQQVADISHLPHTVAAALVRLQTPEALQLAARGFTDTTRIAAGDSNLWRDILLDNRDNIQAGIRRLQQELATIAARLDAGDGESVRDWLAAAADRRQQLDSERNRERTANHNP